MRRRSSSEPLVERLDAAAYSIPAEQPESDGTYEWDRTIIVLVEAAAAVVRGTGYAYADVPTAALVEDKLAKVVIGRSAMNIPEAFVAMTETIRNLGRPGVCSMAIAAVDAALRPVSCSRRPPGHRRQAAPVRGCQRRVLARAETPISAPVPLHLTRNAAPRAGPLSPLFAPGCSRRRPRSARAQAQRRR